ncbi:alpha/beta-hydrolase [Periconia macrospinosa]|uniref:Alpha/beta-hydrolase n=1 Tax=Periconia macrospinosa TaxID=97972 RepID=A0A2V1DSV9_9PLEO|nr:alpha/beta-hydrolase [Periconia macrospinosa]
MSCPDCFRGGISKNHPTGKEVIVNGYPTYVAEPEAGISPKGIIVFITDAFGWDFVNNRVLCDHYAKEGFLVYCPDLMNGRSLSPSIIAAFDLMSDKSTSWFTAIFIKPFVILKCLCHVVLWIRSCKPPKTEAGVIKFFQALRTSPPPFPTQDLKIGAAGFCWGGKHAVTLAQDRPEHRVTRHFSQSLSSAPELLIDAAFVAHPSYIKVPDDVELIKVPISWSVGEEDMQMKGPDVQNMKTILEDKTDANHEVKLIPSAVHGFAIRNHPEDKEELRAAQLAEDQAVSWFSRWFS